MKSARRRFLVASGILLAVGLIASSTAGAQCTFQQPRKAKNVRLPLIPAFVSCGGSCNLCGTGEGSPIPVPNVETGVGFPGCNPPQTFNEHAGSPAGGWLWGPNSQGSVSFKGAKSKFADPSSGSPNTTDVVMTIKLSDIRYASGEPVNGTGILQPVSRGTLSTRANGNMTVLDLSSAFQVPVKNGKALVKSSANVWLDAVEGTSLPGCTALELLQLEITDEEGNPFAVPGLFLSEVIAPPTPTPTPTPTGPTPTGPTPTPTPGPTTTPRTRCCKVEGGGCVDLVAGAAASNLCQPTYAIYPGKIDPRQNVVCNGGTGTCELMRSSNSFCCGWNQSMTNYCVEGPEWDTSYCQSQHGTDANSYPATQCHVITGLCQ